MYSDIYWIDDPARPRLAIMARPRSGDWLEGEIHHWKRSGIGIVVSLLEPDEIEDLGLAEEAALCICEGIEFRSFPIPDRGLPLDEAAFRRFIAGLAETGDAIAIHCRAGIGRSSLVAGSIMIARGTSPDWALTKIAEARGLPVPDTDDQRAWILKFSPSA